MNLCPYSLVGKAGVLQTSVTGSIPDGGTKI